MGPDGKTTIGGVVQGEWKVNWKWLELAGAFVFINFMIQVIFQLNCLKKHNKANDDVMFKINGYVDAQYKEVEDMLRTYYRNGTDDHSQLVVYVGDQKVVDLWGEPAQPSENMSII